jgi:regulator-associated protein of mTOR
LPAAIREATEIDSQLQKAGENDAQIAKLHPPIYSKTQIHFAACGPEETLPKVPGFPDDLFTSCLQTPLRVALLFHNFQTFPIMATRHDRAFSQRAAPYMEALYYSMSKQLKERLWKEMQALLSTIAWHVLDAERYQFLFGHNGDLISNLACGSLLAQRVMSTYHATPESIPHIPWSTAHSLWTTWDLMLDSFFEQLPPYFDEDVADHSWEDDLRLVSFIGDQLEGVFTPDIDAATNSDPIAVMGMSRMPIMCSAALFPEHRQVACEALATCLPSLSIRDLAKAVQGGALDVALQLLNSKEDFGLAPQLISIWSSLMRDSTSITLLSTEARTVKRISDLQSVKFFLDHLDKNLNAKRGEEDRQIIVQTAAILATVANHVGGRSAPYFVARTLQLAGLMLEYSDGLVQQWGSLLIAEITGSLEGAIDDEENKVLKKRLLGLVENESVDTRATALYALSRRIPIKPAKDIIELGEAVSLTVTLLPLAQTDGSPIVRKEIVGISRRLLTNACSWTTLVLLIFALQLAVFQLPDHVGVCEELMGDLGDKINIRLDQKQLLFGLSDILKRLTILQHDPDMRVVKVTYALISKMVAQLKPYMTETEFTVIFDSTFPAYSHTPVWTVEMVEVLKKAGKEIIANWDSSLGVENDLFQGAVNNDLFETSKMSLQDHLSVSANSFLEIMLTRQRHDDRKPTAVAKDKVQPGPSEKTYILRHRALEDAMVVAEQQGTLLPEQQ